jgi:hypothetical protein
MSGCDRPGTASKRKDYHKTVKPLTADRKPHSHALLCWRTLALRRRSMKRFTSDSSNLSCRPICSTSIFPAFTQRRNVGSLIRNLFITSGKVNHVVFIGEGTTDDISASLNFRMPFTSVLCIFPSLIHLLIVLSEICRRARTSEVV